MGKFSIGLNFDKSIFPKVGSNLAIITDLNLLLWSEFAEPTSRRYAAIHKKITTGDKRAIRTHEVGTDDSIYPAFQAGLSVVHEEWMSKQPENTRTNLTRRAFGVMLAFSPLALSIASLAIGIIKGQQSSFAGVGFVIGAAVMAAHNFYLSFVRPYLFRIRCGSMDGFRFVSGVPIVGSILVVLGALFGFGAVGTALIGIIVFLLDTGGSGWIVIATWRDRSFWDVR